MSINSVNPLTDVRWQQVVDRYGGSLFHSPAWMRAVADTYDLDIQALVLTGHDGIPIAGIPFCHIHDYQGERTKVLPFSDYCDPLVTCPQEWQQLADGLLANGQTLTIRCLHSDFPLDDQRFALTNQARWHGLELSQGPGEIWQSIDPATRRSIRRAENEGVVVRQAESEEELRVFFDLHLRVRKYKYRLLAQPYRFFENIWQQFHSTSGEQTMKLMLAVYQGQIIAGAMFLGWKNGIFYKFNASDSTYLTLRPNDLIIWEAIKYAHEHGFGYLDFGLSDWDQAGLIRFKRKFSTEEKVIRFLQSQPSVNHHEGISHVQDILGGVTRLFTDPAVPDAVSEQAGALLYRYFV
jgi:CelD/BcsL family acetyltransferase involved in cellulose biosynthesis